MRATRGAHRGRGLPVGAAELGGRAGASPTRLPGWCERCPGPWPCGPRRWLRRQRRVELVAGVSWGLLWGPRPPPGRPPAPLSALPCALERDSTPWALGKAPGHRLTSLPLEPRASSVRETPPHKRWCSSSLGRRPGLSEAVGPRQPSGRSLGLCPRCTSHTHAFHRQTFTPTFLWF